MIQRLLAISLVQATRPALRLPCRTCYAPRSHTFSTTPRIQVDNNLAAFNAAFQKTTVFKRLANHPEAIKSIEDMTVMLKEAGVDVTSGQKPGALKMAKLAMNSKFRAQIAKVAEEMKKANVDFSSKEVMDEIMALQKAMGTPK